MGKPSKPKYLPAKRHMQEKRNILQQSFFCLLAFEEQVLIIV